MPQPELLRSNGVDRRIQRTKQVRNTIERSSDYYFVVVVVVVVGGKILAMSKFMYRRRL
jgi:hypothetical protein